MNSIPASYTLPKSTKWPVTTNGINRLLDECTRLAELKNDAALSRALEVAPPVISKLRNDRLPLGASLIIRMHEAFGLSIADIKDLATEGAA
jgi:plasmid maintenance system antidote protein VapI